MCTPINHNVKFTWLILCRSHLWRQNSLDQSSHAPFKTCCGIWHQDVSSWSFKLWKLWSGIALSCDQTRWASLRFPHASISLGHIMVCGQLYLCVWSAVLRCEVSCIVFGCIVVWVPCEVVFYWGVGSAVLCLFVCSVGTVCVWLNYDVGIVHIWLHCNVGRVHVWLYWGVGTV